MPRPKKGWKGGSLFLADRIGICGGNLKAGTREGKAEELSGVIKLFLPRLDFW
jgi:hypothetical protein